MGVRPSTDEMNDITVLRELEKMKKWIIDYTWGRTIDHLDFKYGTGEEANKVTLTITLLDGSVETASFRIKTITEITTEIVGDLTYIVVTLSDGTIFRTPLDLSTLVNITEDQTIDGNKNFIGGVEVPDISHEEGEELVQETNKAVNERFFKIHATERIDGIEDELGDPEQPGTIRGDLAEKQEILRSGRNIKTVNGQSILGEGNIPIAIVGTWGNIGGEISDQTDLVEFVLAKMQSIYPVGSIYMNANNNSNPLEILGFGTWVEFGNGKVLVGVDPNDIDFSESGLTGGEKSHIITANEMAIHEHTINSTDSTHTHTGNAQSNGSHAHRVWSSGDTTDHCSGAGNNECGRGLGGVTESSSGGSYYSNDYRSHQLLESNGSHTHTLSINNGGSHTHGCESAGGNEAHNNLQPYITVYMWVRTE